MSFHVIVVHVPGFENGNMQRVVLEAPNAPDAIGHADELNRANCLEYGFGAEYYAVILDTATNGWAYNLTLDTSMMAYRAEELLSSFEAWRESTHLHPSLALAHELETKGEGH